jgi:hypothetical protein
MNPSERVDNCKPVYLFSLFLNTINLRERFYGVTDRTPTSPELMYLSTGINQLPCSQSGKTTYPTSSGKALATQQYILSRMLCNYT